MKLFTLLLVSALVLSGCKTMPDEEHVFERAVPVIEKEGVPIYCSKIVPMEEQKISYEPGIQSTPEYKVQWLGETLKLVKEYLQIVKIAASDCGVKFVAN